MLEDRSGRRRSSVGLWNGPFLPALAAWAVFAVLRDRECKVSENSGYGTGNHFSSGGLRGQEGSALGTGRRPTTSTRSSGYVCCKDSLPTFFRYVPLSRFTNFKRPNFFTVKHGSAVRLVYEDLQNVVVWLLRDQSVLGK